VDHQVADDRVGDAIGEGTHPMGLDVQRPIMVMEELLHHRVEPLDVAHAEGYARGTA